jgi:hypothetical protein
LDEDGEAGNTDRQEVPDDVSAEGMLPNLERVGVIRGLLLTSRLTREEALNVLYGENSICLRNQTSWGSALLLARSREYVIPCSCFNRADITASTWRQTCGI